jgi:hypothetical protein
MGMLGPPFDSKHRFIDSPPPPPHLVFRICDRSFVLCGRGTHVSALACKVGAPQPIRQSTKASEAEASGHIARARHTRVRPGLQNQGSTANSLINQGVRDRSLWPHREGAAGLAFGLYVGSASRLSGRGTRLLAFRAV